MNLDQVSAKNILHQKEMDNTIVESSESTTENPHLSYLPNMIHLISGWLLQT